MSEQAKRTRIKATIFPNVDYNGFSMKNHAELSVTDEELKAVKRLASKLNSAISGPGQPSIKIEETNR